jgi:nucleoside-diphosphate-sugar epimerase
MHTSWQKEYYVVAKPKRTRSAGAKTMKKADSTRPTVVITGATGFLGSALVKHFINKGWQVVALVRDPSRVNGKAVRSYQYELGDPIDDAAFAGADYLIHTAYIKYDRAHPSAMEINIRAAEQLLAMSRKHHLKTNIFMSSMSAHEDAISVYGRQKLAIESLFNTKNDVSLRSGMIIGYGGILKEMVDFMRTKGMVPLVGGGRQPLQIISIYNLSDCIEQCLLKHLSGVLTVANPTIYTYKDFYAAISRRINAKPRFIPVPFFILHTALKLAALLHVPLGISEDNLLGLKKLRASDNAADMKRIGIPSDDLPTALAKTDLPM